MFSAMICGGLLEHHHLFETASLIHRNAGFSVLKCGLDTPVLFYLQDVQK